MSFTYKLRTRNLISTWFSLSFILLLIGYLVFIELFQDSKNNGVSLDLLSKPLTLQRLQAMTQMEFKNRLGNFLLVNENKNWKLKKPRVIPAKKETVRAIFNALTNLEIQTVHELEPLNIRNFSLDDPLVELKLSSANDDINIKIGLINPINNTSYILISGNNQIYQTTMFEYQFESLALTDFIDSGVFSVSLSNIRRFSLYQGRNSSPNNVLEQTPTGWISKKYKTIKNSKVNSKIQSYLDIKTHMIVDRVNTELKNFIGNYLGNPLYKIVIKTKSGKTLTYKVTSLIKSVKELKIESKQFFIMSASDRPYPFIVPKSYIERIFIRYSDLK